jgi:polar amino acid transport system substrate-binding protein
LLTTGLGVAFAKDDDRGLAEKLNQTLNEMRKDGTMEKLIHRYLDHSDTYLEVDSLEKN